MLLGLVTGYVLLDGTGASAPHPGRDPSVQGVVAIEPALRTEPGGYVFVSLRPAGQPTAAPLAVQRLPAAALPAGFELGANQSMLGRPWPPQLEVEAHLDADGDPLTHTSSEPSARLSNVAPGARGLRLVLREGR